MGLRYDRHMCRLAAYLGPSIDLGQFLLQPDSGLMQQSWAPQEMKEGKLNADGYGFAWYNSDQCAAVYTNPMPIWSDPNLRHLARSLHGDLWLASVRSATRYTDINHSNTQPFTNERLIFLHNGYIKDFPSSLRPRIRQLLRPEIEADVEGNTDSEYLFALLRQIMHEQPTLGLEQALSQLVHRLSDWLADTRALLNFILSDGHTLISLRHAINGESPSLYYTQEEANYPGATLIASEPLTESDSWITHPQHQILVIQRQQALRFIPLTS